MGFFSDAKKRLASMWKEGGEAAEKIVDDAVDIIENVGNFTIDGVQKLSNSTIDFIQGANKNENQFMQQTSGFTYDSVGGALNNTSNGIESAFSPNVFSSMLDKLADGVELAGSIENTVYNTIIDNTTDTIDKNVYKFDGMQDIVDDFDYNSRRLIKNIAALFKNDNGIETEASVREGLKKVAKYAMEIGQSLEVKLDNGYDLIFNPSDRGCEVYSADDLTDSLGMSDNGGLFNSETLDEIIGKVQGDINFERDTLKKSDEPTFNNFLNNMIRNNDFDTR